MDDGTGKLQASIVLISTAEGVDVPQAGDRDARRPVLTIKPTWEYQVPGQVPNPVTYSQSATPNMALFCDFENIAIGVKDAKYADFDVSKVVERLLLKGSIVVKKAYCDWHRYKDYKQPMHEAAFELIEIPHKHQAGKNSADIRLVVDALDLCYTKSHVDTFVIISGDSDFSPLVSKLRENDKFVIGVGVKQSTSDLLMANCDEFIFYDDLVREQKTPPRPRRKGRAKTKSTGKVGAPKAKAQPPAAPQAAKSGEPAKSGEEDERTQKAMDLIVSTIDALIDERGEEETIWGSMVKQAIKRRRPGFRESYYGFRAFSELLEEAQARELIELELDEKSGGYRIKAVFV